MDAASYDALGNLLVNPSGGGSYVYDAESRLISAGGLKYIAACPEVSWRSRRNAGGRRVAKLSGSTVTNEYLFDTDGSQQIELNGSGTVLHTNLYAAGKLIATYNGTDTYFHFTDWLGTRRYEANSAGAMTEICSNLPFGDSQVCTGTPDATEHHFAGKERDTESNLDEFGARYYASDLGRFITPDWAAKPVTVPYATFGSPQTLNLYGYVGSNPTTILDSDGHCPDGMDVCFMPKLAKDANYMNGVRRGAAQGAAAFAAVAALAGAVEAGGGVLLRNLLGLAMANAGRLQQGAAAVVDMAAPPGTPAFSVAGAAEAFGFKSFDMAGNLFGGELKNGSTAAVSFSKSGSQMGVGISFVQGPAGTLKDLETGAINAGKSAGAETVKITASMVSDSLAKLLSSQGFTQEIIDGQATGNWSKVVKVTGGIGNEKRP